MESGVKYLDVCDDVLYGVEVKKLSEKVKVVGVVVIMCVGIYFGVLNFMARDIVESMKAEFRAIEENEGKEFEVEYVFYNYFIVGLGGVGMMILVMSYLFCGEDVVCWEDG